MKYFRKRVSTAAGFIRDYRPPEPFHLHLRKCFKADRKFGSKDRKALRELCYSFWRIGYFFNGDLESNLAMGWITQHPEIARGIASELTDDENELIEHLTSDEYANTLDAVTSIPQLNASRFQTYQDYISAEIKVPDYYNALLSQPQTWIRLRTDNSELTSVLKNEYPDIQVMDSAIGLPASVPLDRLSGDRQKEFVVQDIASQAAINKVSLSQGMKVWDLCCGSGGKALAMLDSEPEIEIFMSDLRPGILKQMKERLRPYGAVNYRSAVHNAAKPSDKIVFKNNSKGENVQIEQATFDLVLCDVPCTGSGTWSRTPEDRCHFKTKKLEFYSDRQSDILNSAAPFVKVGGELWYMTCSVFSVENEEVVIAFDKEHDDLQLLNSGYCNYLSKGGDCLYFAQFQRKTQS